MFPNISYFSYYVLGIGEPDGTLSFFKTYGIFLFLAIVLAVSFFNKSLKIYQHKNNLFTIPNAILPERFSSNMILISAISGIIGSKIFALFEYKNHFDILNIGEIIFYKTGISFLGGLLFATITSLFYFNYLKLKKLIVFDLSCAPLCIGYGIGRLGCYFSGDGCWGTMAARKPDWWFLPDSFWSYHFPNNVINYGIPIPGCQYKHCFELLDRVYPTSLYEALIAFCFFIFFKLTEFKNYKPGILFSLYLILSGASRFLIEFIRVNSKYNIFHIYISQAQIISLILIIIGFILMLLILLNYIRPTKVKI